MESSGLWLGMLTKMEKKRLLRYVSLKNMNERTLQSKLTAYLRANGWLVWVNHGSIYMPAGLPDLMALRNGIFIAIELKVPGKKPTPVQNMWISDINCQQHYAFWADNLPAIKYLLDGIINN